MAEADFLRILRLNSIGLGLARGFQGFLGAAAAAAARAQEQLAVAEIGEIQENFEFCRS